MTDHNPILSVDVDVTNPGQFFACCGLLELAHRLCPGAEGWFAPDHKVFNVCGPADGDCRLERLLDKLVDVRIDGELSPREREELECLETKKRRLKKEKKDLSKTDEERRKSLGKRHREGALFIGEPFNLRIAWWQEEGEDVPKTFAGRQEVLRMATAMLSKVCEAVERDKRRIFEYRCLLSGDRKSARGDSKVEPFYFDALRFAHALDVGFSLDVQEKTIRASAAPVTELLALIGLQRFRPRQCSDSKWSFEYWTWPHPLCAPVAAAVACGSVAIVDSQGYRFSLKYRHDQKRYKAFSFATPIGGKP